MQIPLNQEQQQQQFSLQQGRELFALPPPPPPPAHEIEDDERAPILYRLLEKAHANLNIGPHQEAISDQESQALEAFVTNFIRLEKLINRKQWQ